VKAEVNDDVAALDNRSQIVALINLADDFDFGMVRGTGQQRVAHAAS
jgi:hypothetical protein